MTYKSPKQIDNEQKEMIKDLTNALKDAKLCPCEIPFSYGWCEKHRKWN